MPEPTISRRRLLIGGGALAVVGTAAACTRPAPTQLVGPTSAAVRTVEQARTRPGARTVLRALEPRPAMIDLGGPQVRTWAYADSVPGPLLRARVGDTLQVDVANRLPAETSVHWHGVALRNDMDGVPGMTQSPIRPGTDFRYTFTLRDPGTYWYHPHVGLQLDSGLYGPLIVDDPADPGRYDVEYLAVLDDWLDGTGTTPDAALRQLESATDSGGMGGMAHGGMGGMAHGGMGRMAGGDVSYPYYLINGRVAAAPAGWTGRAGQRARIRLINAAADTAFRIALGGHRLTVTHTDGFPVAPVTVDTLLIGMGERYDVEVTLGDGVFPLVGVPDGKNGQALAVLRTGAGTAPPDGVRPGELSGRGLALGELQAAGAVRLPARRPDRTHDLLLAGTMAPYRWTINGRTFDRQIPLPVRSGELVRLRFANRSMMSHPMHVHGHTFQLRGPGWSGPRKDTVLVPPMAVLTADLVADNPGQWATHCHNAYHMAAGMMTTLSYRN